MSRALLALCAAGLLVAYLARGDDPSSAVAPPPAAIVPAVRGEGAGPQAGLPPECAQRYPRNTSVHFERSFAPRDVASGIACPGGGFLPLLNGVPHAPAVNRDVERFGPVPPVVGKRTDADGDEWWVHADGSETTSRFTTVTVGGVARSDVRTDHTVPAPAEHGLVPAGAVQDR